MGMTDDFDKNNIMAYWVESSDNDYKTTIDLFNTGNYGWALFMGHLVIEKLLKARYVKINGKYPPMIHDLRRIGEAAGIEFDEYHTVTVETISQFNIRARYDDYKRNFYKLCTAEYAKEWIEKIKDIRLWIKTMLSD
jgi:HEPN domain-containing protein